MEIKLWSHQEKAIVEAKNREYYGLWAEMGVGKTFTTIEIIRNKFKEHNQILPTLVFCPSVVVGNWKNELLKFTKVKPEKIILLKGTQTERIKLVEESETNSIFVTNFEALSVMPDLISKIEAKFLSYDKPKILICDEVHRLKDPTAKRTKRAIDLSRHFKYRYVLTGTPILNNLMDIYAQFRILDQGKNFGHNFFSFRARFFEDKNRFMPAHVKFPNWQPVKGAAEAIKKIVHENGMIARKADCLTLPPLVNKIIEVEMGSEQKRLYDSMKKDFIASFDMKNSSGVTTKTQYSIAELAITKALRLNQIVSGHVKLEGTDGEDGLVVNLKDNPRKKALKELLEDIAPYHKVIIWSVFKANYDDIKDVCSELKLGWAEITGATKDKQAMVDLFQNDSDIRVCIGNPASAGIGINLTAASCMIYYSRGFSLEHDLQSESRCYRGGSEKHESITRIDLVTKGTIDELVMTALSNKQELSEKILRQNLNNL